MHSSWMRTVRCSSRPLGGGGVCPVGSAGGGGQNDRRLWKITLPQALIDYVQI